MASVVSILVTARNQANAAFNAATAQARRMTSSVGSAVSRLNGYFRNHHRLVSSVAGAYQDANGQWRDANGRLLLVRHQVHTVTNAYGDLLDRLRAVVVWARLAGNAMGRLSVRALQAGAALALSMVPGLAMIAAKATLVLAVLAPLAAALAHVAGAAQLGPAAILAGAAALVTLKLGLNGVSEAIEAGLSGDLDEFREKLKKLAPAARDFAQSAVMIVQHWKPVQQAVQQQLFGAGNLAHKIRQLSIEYKPLASMWLPRLAGGFSEAGRRLADWLIQANTKTEINNILAETDRFLRGILNSITPLAQAFMDVAAVAAPTLGDIGEKAEGLAGKFAAWIRQAKESGQLQQWLDKAKETLGKLGEIAENVGRTVVAMFSAGQAEGEAMLDSMVANSRAMAEWAESDSGQKIIDMFAKIGAAITVISPLLGFMAVAFTASFKTGILMIQACLNTFLFFVGSMINGAAAAFGWIPGIGPKLRDAQTKFWEFAGGVNKALDGIRDRTVNVTVRYREVGRNVAISSDYQSGIGGRASGGLATGLKWVGERGRELVDFGARTGRVYNHGESERMAATGGGGGGGRGGTWRLEVAPAPTMGRTLSDALIRELAFRVRTDGRGSIDTLLAGIA